MTETQTFTIASRQSPLARVQAEWVGANLMKSGHQVAYLWLTSSGDRFTGRLSEAKGKGMFATEIEQALLDGKADIAVHSLKDLPASAEEQTTGLLLAAHPTRENPADVLISRHNATCIQELPQHAIVGTSSARRQAQMARVRPDLQFKLLRGNIQTRIEKTMHTPYNAGGVDATLLALAGLKRMGYAQIPGQTLDTDTILPAPGQAALALQCREGDTKAIEACKTMHDPETDDAIKAERDIAAALGADCHSAIACLCYKTEQIWQLNCKVWANEGTSQVSFSANGPDLNTLKSRAIQTLIEENACELIQQSTACKKP